MLTTCSFVLQMFYYQQNLIFLIRYERDKLKTIKTSLSDRQQTLVTDKICKRCIVQEPPFPLCPVFSSLSKKKTKRVVNVHVFSLFSLGFFLLRFNQAETLIEMALKSFIWTYVTTSFIFYHIGDIKSFVSFQILIQISMKCLLNNHIL